MSLGRFQARVRPRSRSRRLGLILRCRPTSLPTSIKAPNDGTLGFEDVVVARIHGTHGRRLARTSAQRSAGGALAASQARRPSTDHRGVRGPNTTSSSGNRPARRKRRSSRSPMLRRAAAWLGPTASGSTWKERAGWAAGSLGEGCGAQVRYGCGAKDLHQTVSKLTARSGRATLPIPLPGPMRGVFVPTDQRSRVTTPKSVPFRVGFGSIRQVSVRDKRKSDAR